VALLASEAYGTHHIAGGGACSWAELAAETFRRAGSACQVVPVATSEMPRPALRPAYSALASERPETPRLRRWQEGLAAYLGARARRPDEVSA
jgi:dTDP-4-dehydrorhamnose reductase